MRSDLTFFELMKLYFGLRNVRADKIAEFDLLALEVLEPSSLADGTKVYSANTRLDSFTVDNLSDSKIKSEQLTIAVLNGANYPGLAQKVSRMISNIGGNVIISDNTGPVEHSFVVGKTSFTKNKLKEIFHSKYAKIEPQAASRAQIVIFLGEDLKPKL
ncbi:MAG: Uncharacterized protein CEO21_225 [Microgenomates group bacterium Gr01-1014_80]|nr:MAG: Uncharacterized protein CEO21_225 [Microgenomates group bacterium Gr01-1014_80]